MKMRVTIMLVLLFVGKVFSQTLTPSIITTAGDSYQNNYSYLDITIGELITETSSNTNCILTQGFQQSQYYIDNIETVTNDDFQIEIFPNPTTGIIQIEFCVESKFSNLRLFAENGELLINKQVTGISVVESIDLSFCAPGTYYLEISDITIENRFAYKIVKQ